SLLLNNYTGTPDMNAAVYSKIEYTLKFDPSYGDNTEYSLGSFENVKPADFMGTKKSFNVNNGPLNDAMDKLRDRPKFKVFSKYTLQSGAGTIEAMNGTLEFTFSLVAGV
ncbi:MAG: hypothetical protein JNL32_15675, partial [Candidatus Kapabacteria bacterium]|nr:hypothetical protein [Candidatus Kapabacteria bacterium]